GLLSPIMPAAIMPNGMQLKSCQTGYETVSKLERGLPLVATIRQKQGNSYAATFFLNGRHIFLRALSAEAFEQITVWDLQTANSVANIPVGKPGKDLYQPSCIPVDNTTFLLLQKEYSPKD